MTTAQRSDPLPGFNFVVELVESGGGQRAVAGFSECTGLESTLEIEEYLEGGVNDRVHKFPTRFTFTNVVLKRGVTVDGTLRDWHQALLKGNVQRRDGMIFLRDESGQDVLAWRFERGLPVKWSGPALNAGSSEAAIETLEIAVERLEPVAV